MAEKQSGASRISYNVAKAISSLRAPNVISRALSAHTMGMRGVANVVDSKGDGAKLARRQEAVDAETSINFTPAQIENLVGDGSAQIDDEKESDHWVLLNLVQSGTLLSADQIDRLMSSRTTSGHFCATLATKRSYEVDTERQMNL